LKRVICLGDLNSWHTSLIYWDSYKYPYPKWNDEYKNELEFVRSIDMCKYHVNNGNIVYWEKFYNFPNRIIKHPDKIYDDKIGSLDF
jgi:hypothetical protein